MVLGTLNPAGGMCWFLVQTGPSYQEESLNLGHGSPQDRAHVVAHAGQQNAKHGDAHQGIAHAEQLSIPGPWRQVPEPWRQFRHIHLNPRGEEPSSLSSVTKLL